MSIKINLSSHYYQIGQRDEYLISEDRDFLDRISNGNQLYIKRQFPRENKIFELLRKDYIEYFEPSTKKRFLVLCNELNDYVERLGHTLEIEKDSSYKNLKYLGLFVFGLVEQELKNLPPFEEPSPELVLEENFINEIGFSDIVKKYLRDFVRFSFQQDGFDADQNIIIQFANYALIYWISVRKIFKTLKSGYSDENE